MRFTKACCFSLGIVTVTLLSGCKADLSGADKAAKELREGIHELAAGMEKAGDAIDPVAVKEIFRDFRLARDEVDALKDANKKLQQLIEAGGGKDFPYFIDLYMGAWAPKTVEMYLLSKDGASKYSFADVSRFGEFRYKIPANAIVQYDGKIYFNIELDGNSNITDYVEAHLYRTVGDPGPDPDPDATKSANGAHLKTLHWARPLGERGPYVKEGPAKQEFVLWAS